MGNIDNYKILFKDLIISIIITLILLLVLSMVLSLTNVSENIIGGAVIFISRLSILIGAFLASRKIKEKGIVFGSILGLTYMISLYIISSVLNSNFSLSLTVLYMFLGGLIGGSLGGILGVNLK